MGSIRKYHVTVDLSLIPTKNFRLENVATGDLLISPGAGYLVYDSDLDLPKIFTPAGYVNLAPDNLGDHKATQDLDLQTNKLVGNGGSKGLSIDANGNLFSNGKEEIHSDIVTAATGRTGSLVRFSEDGLVSSIVENRYGGVDAVSAFVAGRTDGVTVTSKAVSLAYYGAGYTRGGAPATGVNFYKQKAVLTGGSETTGLVLASDQDIHIESAGKSVVYVNKVDGNVGIGLDDAGATVPGAKLHLGAGTATNPALKMTAGVVLGTEQNGAFEYTGSNIYFTIGGVRRDVLLGGAETIPFGDLVDVDTYGVVDDDHIRYDSGSGEWKVGTWRESSTAIYPVTTGADVGTPTKRVATVYMSSEINYAGAWQVKDSSDADKVRFSIGATKTTISPQTASEPGDYYGEIFEVVMPATDDGYVTLGNARIGAISAGGGNLYMAHKNFFNVTSYGFYHGSDGATFINSHTGKDIVFTVGNGSALVRIETNQVTLAEDAATSVGIGINPTNAKLDIKGSLATQHSVVIRSGTDVTGTDRKSGGFDWNGTNLYFYTADNSAPTDLLAGGGGDGIYAASGTIPTTTVATLTDTFQFTASQITFKGADTITTKNIHITDSASSSLFYVQNDGDVVVVAGDFTVSSGFVDAQTYRLEGNLFLHVGSDILDNSIYIGVGAGNITATGENNVAVGPGALVNLTSGIGNFALGVDSLSSYTIESNTIAIGVRAGDLATGLAASELAIYIGPEAGRSHTGGDSIIMGSNASNMMSGDRNYIFQLEHASNDLTTGFDNLFAGHNRGKGITIGARNVHLGATDTTAHAADTRDTIVIGYGGVASGFNQMIIGKTPKSSASGAINQLYFGTPDVVQAWANNPMFISAQSVAAGVADQSITSSELAFRVGRGTGTGTAGIYSVYGAPAGSTASTQNAWVKGLALDGELNLSIHSGGADPSAGADKFYVYSKDHNGATTATMHVLNEEGDEFIYLKAAALTAVDATVIDATYGTVEEAVINNMRIRIGELEALLQANGLLT